VSTGTTATTSPTVTIEPSPKASALTDLGTIDGVAFYYTVSLGAAQVWSLGRGGVVTGHLRIPIPAQDYCVDNSVIVSPDGQRVAWVTDDQTQGDLYGRLTVARLDGGEPRPLDHVLCSFDERTWMADSRWMRVIQMQGGNSQPLLFDVVTGALRTPTADGLVWSANRAFRARRDVDTRTLLVESADGRVVHRFAGYSNDSATFSYCGYTIKGVSDDGRYVAIGTCSTDPSRALGARHLLDMVAKRHVRLPIPRVDSITFVGGRVLLHGSASKSESGSLALMSYDGKVIATVREPPGLPTGARYLSYTHVS
jgi:hypothetical protein